MQTHPKFEDSFAGMLSAIVSLTLFLASIAMLAAIIGDFVR